MQADLLQPRCPGLGCGVFPAGVHKGDTGNVPLATRVGQHNCCVATAGMIFISMRTAIVGRLARTPTCLSVGGNAINRLLSCIQIAGNSSRFKLVYG